MPEDKDDIATAIIDQLKELGEFLEKCPAGAKVTIKPSRKGMSCTLEMLQNELDKEAKEAQEEEDKITMMEPLLKKRYLREKKKKA